MSRNNHAFEDLVQKTYQTWLARVTRFQEISSALAKFKEKDSSERKTLSRTIDAVIRQYQRNQQKRRLDESLSYLDVPGPISDQARVTNEDLCAFQTRLGKLDSVKLEMLFRRLHGEKLESIGKDFGYDRRRMWAEIKSIWKLVKLESPSPSGSAHDLESQCWSNLICRLAARYWALGPQDE